ncbi:hypothetical protein GCM10027405_03160 [Arthrobacter alkaliphilus]|uniref:hypothetical protein n=1 Tax=Arthrobacter alkaliphilus TaxID=369936 RepID=UPI001F3382EA|nr:hypothetical protein [Arthrobacter alkaliphilus]
MGQQPVPGINMVEVVRINQGRERAAGPEDQCAPVAACVPELGALPGNPLPGALLDPVPDCIER